MNKNIVSFDLKGDFACFRKHDANDIIYTTYNFIHRPAVLGIIGAILGYKGYGQSERKEPEYYNKLKNLKIGISPKFENVPSKVILTFNNASGLASKETGGVWQVSEQVMFDLKNKINYTIYIDLESIGKDISDKLLELLEKKYSNFPIYFGKNEFLAYYDNVKYYEKCIISPDELKENRVKINTIIPISYLKDPFKIEVKLFDSTPVDNVKIMFEILPVDFDNNFIYVKEKFAWITKGKVILKSNNGIIKIKDSNGNIEYIYFF
jgi:CRISPR-associated protein Cas5h